MITAPRSFISVRNQNLRRKIDLRCTKLGQYVVGFIRPQLYGKELQKVATALIKIVRLRLWHYTITLCAKVLGVVQGSQVGNSFSQQAKMRRFQQHFYPEDRDRTCLRKVVFNIIIIHFPDFTAVQPVLKSVRVSLTKHFLFTVLPNTISLYSMYQVLLMSALEYAEQGGDKAASRCRVVRLE